MSPNPEPHHPKPGQKMGKGMLTLAWIIALGLLTVVFGYWEEKQYNPNQSPTSSIDDKGREVVLTGNKQHHYIATGKINGQPVTFLLDTGASDVAIPQKLARRLGLKPGGRSYAQTANGMVEVRTTRIATLELGVIQLKNVRASINPGMTSNEILLGMSALRQVEFTQRGNQLTLRQIMR